LLKPFIVFAGFLYTENTSGAIKISYEKSDIPFSRYRFFCLALCSGSNSE